MALDVMAEETTTSAPVPPPASGTPARDVRSPRILAFATKGGGSNEEGRLRDLLSAFEVEWFPFDRSAKFGGFRNIVKLLKSRPEDLSVPGNGRFQSARLSGQ